LSFCIDELLLASLLADLTRETSASQND